MGGEVFLRPAWADAPKEYKKGGKVKKAKKAKKVKAKKAKAGDTVMLHRGNVPGYGGGIGALSGGSVHRMASPGNLYGGGLPGPLQSSYYASAPAVAHPLSRVEFIGSSDSYYNRNRVKSDDIQIPVNPSDIQPDVKPSIRFQPSRNPNEPVPSSQYTQNIYYNWQGEIPRVNDLNMRPSVRAMDSKPSTGYLMTNPVIQMDVAGVGHIASDGPMASASDSAFPTPEANVYFDEREYEEEEGLGPVAYPKAQKPIIAGRQGKSAATIVREQFPTLKALHDAGYYTYVEAAKAYRDNGIGYKRGGRVHSAF